MKYTDAYTVRLFDEQMAEIKRLTEVVEILQQDCFNLSEKVLPNVRAERDEWKRRARIYRAHMNIYTQSLLITNYPEAAQWFKEDTK